MIGAAVRRLTLLIAGLSLALVPPLVGAHPLQNAPQCPIFPRDNSWNQRVDALPVAKSSARGYTTASRSGSPTRWCPTMRAVCR
jgi:hypothetical protein